MKDDFYDLLSTTTDANVNVEMLRERKISRKNSCLIILLHALLYAIFKASAMTDSRAFLKATAVFVEQIEYLLQESWGFERNPDFHTWWYKNPKCTCPKLDNDDLIGADYRIYHGDCPIHGEFRNEE